MDQQPARQLITSVIIGSLLLLTIMSAALAGTIPGTPQGKLTTRHFFIPPNHKTQYHIEKFGTYMGDMKNELQYKDGIIHYSSLATAKGFASLFVRSTPKEMSILHWPENAHSTIPQQQSFDYFQGENHKRNQQISFNHSTEGEIQINGSYKHKSYKLKTDKVVWARQLLSLLMSRDLQLHPDTTTNSFYITDKGRIEKYTYTLVATEDFKFKGETLPVLKFKITKNDSRRMSYAWLSKGHYYLPLKIEQYKDGDLNVRMLMTHLNLDKTESK